MDFEFSTATRIVFGLGSFRRIGPLAKELGSRALVATGRRPERAEGLLEYLTASDLQITIFSVHGEPTIEVVQEGVNLARRQGCNLVVGFGGGSVMDTAKAIAILLTNPGDVTQYLEVVGRGQAFTQPGVSCIAIPTTAGTGAEVTRNAVLGAPLQRIKVSMRSPLMLPRLALVDPELTFSLPPEITAYSGLDALTQLIEPYVSNRANPFTDALCREGMQRVVHSLRRAYLDGADSSARADMSIASLFGGLALANSGLGTVHGFAGVLGGMFPASHGAICARLLPFVAKMNVRALQKRAPDHPSLDRYQDIADILTGEADATIDRGIDWILALCRELKVPGLASHGLSAEYFPQVVENTLRASSTRANPIELTPDDLVEILTGAL